MSDINVDDFCKDAARALLILYRAFPRPQTLYVEDVCGPEPVDEFGMPSARHQACFSALLWLAAEGHLRFVDVIRSEAIDQAVLSGSALLRLCAPAPGFEPAAGADLPAAERRLQQTHARHLEAALGERSSTRIRQALLELLGTPVPLAGAAQA